MRNILKAEFKKLTSSAFMYILLVISVLLPLITTGFVALISRLVAEGEANELLGLFSGPLVYASSFSPTNNVGLLVLITVVVLIANDFSQNTIRNKIIAGYSKETIFFSSLLYNLIVAGSVLFVYSSATYVFHGLFNGFNADDFVQIFEYGVIAYSSLLVIYTLVTLLAYHFKNIIAPLLITLGSILGIFAVYSLLNAIPTHIVDFSFLQHVFPLVRLLNVTFNFDMANTSIVLNTKLWWVDLLVNIGHTTWLVLLGLYIAKNTDYK